MTDLPDASACCGALILRRWEWLFWRPRRYRVCQACGFEVDRAGWPAQDPASFLP